MTTRERWAWTLGSTIVLALCCRGAMSIIHDGFMPAWIWNPWH